MNKVYSQASLKKVKIVLKKVQIKKIYHQNKLHKKDQKVMEIMDGTCSLILNDYSN